MDDIKIVSLKSLDDSGLLVDGAGETVKCEIKKTMRQISSCYDGTYNCFSDNAHSFFIDTTCHL